MQFDATFVLNIIAIAVMVYCLYLVISLKKYVPGGIVGKKWNFLLNLIVFFTLGYLCSPFVSMINEEYFKLIVVLIFLFGAVYVAISVNLIYQIIKELSA